MAKTENSAESHQNAVSAIDEFKNNLGPFIVAVETTRLAMIFTDAKTHGNLIAFANDSFLELTGYPRDEVIARSISHVLAHVTRAEAIAKLETALNDGFDGTLEMNCERRDGSQFLAAVYMSPVRNNKGELEQNFVSFVEISGIVDSLVHQRNGLYAVYQNAPGFIAGTIGPDHRFTFANKSYHSFVGRRQLEGRTVAEVLPGSIEQGFIGLLDQVYNTGIPFTGVSMPFRLQRMDGFNSEIRYADFVLQPVRDARGVITGLFSEGHDVTEHRLALDKIAALQNEVIHLSRVSAMETMASTLAHELNQPLAAIISYTAGCGRLIAQGPENLDELANGLAAISECSKRAGDIIRNLREMTKRGKTHRTLFDLKEAIRESVKLARVGVCDDIIVDEQIAEGVELEADRIQIQQVTINLVRNACDAVGASLNGAVTITSSIENDTVTVAVADTGGGVSNSSAPSIFDGVQSEKTEGMGLGLSISRTIIEAHGGRIWLQYSSGKGSCVSFSLPLKCSPVAT